MAILIAQFQLAAQCGVIVDEFIAARRSSDKSSEVRHQAGALEQIRMIDMILSMSVHSDVRIIYPEVS